MADSTKVAYTCAPRNEFLALRGINNEMGPQMIQVAARTDLNVTNTGTLGWYDLGIVTSAVDVTEGYESFSTEVGAISKVLSENQIGRKPTAQFTYMNATHLGKLLATGTVATVSEPTSPIADDIDETAPFATHRKIKVTSSTGFLAGQTIGIVTGNPASYTAREEFVTIKSVDTTNHIIYLEDVLSQLPVDTAAVRVIEKIVYSAEGCNLNEDFQYRIVKHVNSNESVEVMNFGDAMRKNIDGKKNKDGKSPAEYGFLLSIIGEPVETATAGEYEYHYYENTVIYKTA